MSKFLFSSVAAGASDASSSSPDKEVGIGGRKGAQGSPSSGNFLQGEQLTRIIRKVLNRKLLKLFVFKENKQFKSAFIISSFLDL